MNVDLCTLDWVAISAIATLIMVIVTFITLLHNRRQLTELKRQWKEEHKANLSFSIICLEQELYCLRILNGGKSVANNIRFNINEDFVDKLLFKEAKNIFSGFATSSLTLLPNEFKVFPISPIEGVSWSSIGGSETHRGDHIEEQLEVIKDYPIKLQGSYNNESFNVTLTINSFLKNSLVNREEEALELYRIRKHISEIKKHLESMAKTFKEVISKRV